MTANSDARKILLSRALTNSGDQAWDFAVPVSLAVLMPGRLDLVALIFFLIRLGNVLLLPMMGAWLDRLSRLTALQLALGLQFFGVGLQTASFMFLESVSELAYLGLVSGGILSALGSGISQIAVAQDLVPSLFSGLPLTSLNSRIRQLDLVSEVVSPIVAGAVLMLSSEGFLHTGLLFVALWNLISFFPEYLLLRSILVKRKDLLQRSQILIEKTPIWRRLTGGWNVLRKLPIAASVFAYSLLWLSVLSPHGVLLTSYLKEGLRMPELTLGIFRALGAIFGISATFLYPWLVARRGLVQACSFGILFQSFTLILALIVFHLKIELGFLFFILLSRVGLYTFSLGEQELRQTRIPSHFRGSVNATASSLNSLATLALLGLGSVLGGTLQFSLLIQLSVLFVFLGAVIFEIYQKKISSSEALIF